MFSKLFEILPDAEQLLSLEPEELAGPLLISLEGIEEMLLDNVISKDKMINEIQRNSHFKHLNYPEKSCKEVLFAIMEAWQYLMCERFVAPVPEGYSNYSTTTTYFITKRGKKIETLDDYESYRKADLLRKYQLHPIIGEKVWSIFAQGSYGTAVLEAFKQVEIAVREAGDYGETDYGTHLMRKAFHADDSKLTDEKQQEAEKKARYFLFAGAIGAYKNPNSHREVEFDPEEAAEIIIVASHLLRIVDSCAERTSNPPN